VTRRTLTGEVVLEWLEKWPDLPNLTLARMIYNSNDNYKLFNSIEHARNVVRYHRGAAGKENRKKLQDKTYCRNFKTIEYDPSNELR
jgi:hypothetical protein